MNWKPTFAAIGVAVGMAVHPLHAADINWDMANEYNDTSIHAEGDKVFFRQAGGTDRRRDQDHPSLRRFHRV
ncbi:hypothetical protein QW131_00445 [Roseibium salinum]|nr:hypothetical protein [Roseibium salinum]